eukprot:gnl/MRDRNA2_/MRDRNA2_36430_c0_seq1.p1 gnl/MRDRNA2_/MRDRNA2_36430_c0~~gnl/MRDRNA2_/MRDRNA2_36430_c0_seq1.p1  ORF type:complete len:449 (+),score=83.14 gnl/MRDRNA2_/MRDRNA2_36430_c0_seq1:75-1421(+)
MEVQSMVLAEPLVHEVGPRSFCCSKRAFVVVLSLLIGAWVAFTAQQRSGGGMAQQQPMDFAILHHKSLRSRSPFLVQILNQPNAGKTAAASDCSTTLDACKVPVLQYSLKKATQGIRTRTSHDKARVLRDDPKLKPVFAQLAPLAIVLLAAPGCAHAAGYIGYTSNLDWRYFVSGAVAAAISHGYTTPIDVVKTRMQTNPELYNGSVQVALTRISKDEGPLFLLQGLTPTAVGYGLEGALKFGVYEVLKPVFAILTPGLGNLNFLLASVVAGAIAATVLCPAEDVRIRLVAEPNFAAGPLAALGKIIRTEGPAASFRGLNAMLAKQVPYTMTKQVSFDLVSSLLRDTVPDMYKLYPAVPALTASSITALLSCFASHPGDMLLTATFKQSGEAKSTGEIFNSILKRYGPRGFFLGLTARLGHVVAIVSPQLVIYDICKQALGLPATGSK